MGGKKSTSLLKEGSGVSELFFELLRKNLPPGIGLAEELADLLDISLDGAYRRIRGETELTLSDLSRITGKYRVSIDEVLGTKSNTAVFNYTKLTDSEENFVYYLSRLYSQLKVINGFPDRHIYWIADEAPVFYSFGSPKLAEFKLYFWQRSVLNITRYQQEKFRWGIIPQDLLDIALKSHEAYMQIPCTEVWTDETVLTNIKQVKLHFEIGLVAKEIALELLQEHRKLIEKVHAMAESGRKNISDQKETYKMYSSDVVLGTNCIYVMMGELRYAYISFNSINSLTTGNSEFCDETETWVRNLEKKSTLISGIAEKQRYQFFSNMFKTIDAAILSIQNA
jgi:hypothetical protein